MNLFLCYIASRRATKIGNYKYMILAFAFFECIYALLVFSTVPVFYIYENRLVVFSYSSLLSNTRYADFAAGLYCTFYEIWIGFVVLMFVNRYVVLCRDTWKRKLQTSLLAKMIFILAILAFVVYCFICGTFWCVNDRVPEAVEEKIKNEFQMKSEEKLGYMVATLMHKDNSFSWNGFMAYSNHFTLIFVSSGLIALCGTQTWKRIKTLASGSQNAEVRRNKQIFYTMLLQGLIPLFTYQIPTVFILNYAIFVRDSIFGSITPMMSVFTTMPKVLDPILAILIIKEYRYATIRIIRGLLQRRTVYKTGVSIVSLNVDTRVK